MDAYRLAYKSSSSSSSYKSSGRSVKNSNFGCGYAKDSDSASNSEDDDLTEMKFCPLLGQHFSIEYELRLRRKRRRVARKLGADICWEYLDQPPPPFGAEAKVGVWIATDANTICVQLEGSDEKQAETLANLFVHYNTTSRQRLGLEPMEPLPSKALIYGMPVVAWYPKDGGYYRAIIEEVCDENVKLIYVDYGNLQTLTAEHIFPLYNDFAQWPPLAYRCRLEGCDFLKPEISQKLFSTLIEAQNDFTFVAKFVDTKAQKPPYRIILYDTLRNINEHLINANGQLLSKPAIEIDPFSKENIRPYIPPTMRTDPFAPEKSEKMKTEFPPCGGAKTGFGRIVELSSTKGTIDCSGHRSNEKRGINFVFMKVELTGIDEEAATIHTDFVDEFAIGDDVEFVARYFPDYGVYIATNVMPVGACGGRQTTKRGQSGNQVAFDVPRRLNGFSNNAVEFSKKFETSLPGDRRIELQKFERNSTKNLTKIEYGVVSALLPHDIGYITTPTEGEVLFSSQSVEGMQDGQHLYDCFELGQVVEMEGICAVPLEGNEMHPGLEAMRVRKFGEIREGIGWVSIMYDTYGAIIASGFGYIMFPFSQTVVQTHADECNTLPLKEWLGQEVAFRATREIPGRRYPWRAIALMPLPMTKKKATSTCEIIKRDRTNRISRFNTVKSKRCVGKELISLINAAKIPVSLPKTIRAKEKEKENEKKTLDFQKTNADGQILAKSAERKFFISKNLLLENAENRRCFEILCSKLPGMREFVLAHSK